MKKEDVMKILTEPNEYGIKAGGTFEKKVNELEKSERQAFLSVLDAVTGMICTFAERRRTHTVRLLSGETTDVNGNLPGAEFEAYFNALDEDTRAVLLRLADCAVSIFKNRRA